MDIKQEILAEAEKKFTAFNNVYADKQELMVFLSQAIDRVIEDFAQTAIVEIEAHLPFGSDTFSDGRLTGMRDAVDIVKSLSSEK